MSFEITGIAYGRAAADLLDEQVRAVKGEDPLAPVTVVAPSNYVGVAMRRKLASRGNGIAAVTFLTVYRLGELLGAARLAAAGRRPVSPPVTAAAIRRALADDPASSNRSPSTPPPRKR